MLISPQCSRSRRTRLHGLTLMELVVVVAVVATLTGLMLIGLSPDSLKVTGGAGDGSPPSIATMATMGVVRDAIFGNGVQAGYWKDMGRDPDYWPRYLQWLEQKPGASEIYGSATASYSYATQMLSHSASTGLGWRGPYLQALTGVIPATLPSALGGGIYRSPLDAWGNPILMVPPSNIMSVWAGQFSPAPTNSVTNRWILSNCRLVSAGPNRIYDSITNISDYAAYVANTNLARDDIILWLRE